MRSPSYAVDSTRCRSRSSWPLPARAPLPPSRSWSELSHDSISSRAAATRIRASRRCERRSSGRTSCSRLKSSSSSPACPSSQAAAPWTPRRKSATPISTRSSRSSRRASLRFTGGRYWMLETIREYAAERSCRGGRRRDRERRHSEFFIGLAAEGGRTPGRGGSCVARSSRPRARTTSEPSRASGEAGRIPELDDLRRRVAPFGSREAISVRAPALARRARTDQMASNRRPRRTLNCRIVAVKLCEHVRRVLPESLAVSRELGNRDQIALGDLGGAARARAGRCRKNLEEALPRGQRAGSQAARRDRSAAISQPSS